MFLDIVSIVLTILFGVAGIIVSIYCWKHNYEKQKEHNKLIQKLNALNFNEEICFTKLNSIIVEADTKDIDISKYFNQDKKIYASGKISKNQLMSAVYNLYHNSKSYIEDEQVPPETT